MFLLKGLPKGKEKEATKQYGDPIMFGHCVGDGNVAPLFVGIVDKDSKDKVLELLKEYCIELNNKGIRVVEVCDKCQSDDLLVEKQENGNTICRTCGYQWKSGGKNV